MQAAARGGTQIITTGADRTARIWDRASGQQVGPAVTGHTSWGHAVTATVANRPLGGLTHEPLREARGDTLGSGAGFHLPMRPHTPTCPDQCRSPVRRTKA